VPEKQPPDDVSGEFGIVLDEELMAAALSAVSRLEKPRKRAEAEPAPPKVDEADEGEEIEVDLEVDLEAQPAPAPPPATEHPAVERLRLADQEIARLKGAHRRLEEQLHRAEIAAQDALAARRAAEESGAAFKRRGDQLEADLARMRERRARDVEEQRLHGHARTVEALLPVLDNLELALDHRQADPAVLLKGVQIILEQLHQALHQVGLKRVLAHHGVLFDPAIHEAVSEEQTEELLPGTVVQELRPGYTLNGRMLRAARVTVAAQPGSHEAIPSLSDEFEITGAVPVPTVPDEG
jgi:molecular chaperone GrpE